MDGRGQERDREGVGTAPPTAYYTWPARKVKAASPSADFATHKPTRPPHVVDGARCKIQHASRNDDSG